MKIMFILIVLNIVLISGCSEPNESTKVVSAFWKAFSENDKETLEQILENPEDAEFLMRGKPTVTNYEVLNEVEGGVNVRFSRYCYEDLISPTKLVNVNGRKKIALFPTLKAQIAISKTSTPLKKYCYEFDDKPLSGFLDGSPWLFKKAKNREIDWGTKITNNTTLYSEDCDTETFGKCTKPRLIISNLDLDSEGGNFTNKVNITIHKPPSDNQIITTGSYRVSRFNGEKKVELTFNHDNKNNLSGYYFIK